MLMNDTILKTTEYINSMNRNFHFVKLLKMKKNLETYSYILFLMSSCFSMSDEIKKNTNEIKVCIYTYYKKGDSTNSDEQILKSTNLIVALC